MSWSSLSASSPAGHLGPAVVADPARDRMLVFGGYPAQPCPSPVLWAFALATATWSAIDVTGDPGRRHGDVAVLDAARDRVVLFGGSQVTCTGQSTPSTDVWALTLGAPEWRKLAPDGVAPPFVPIGALYDAPRDRMVAAWRDNSFANLFFALQWGPLVATPLTSREAMASAIRSVVPNPGRTVQSIQLEIASGDRARRLAILDLAGRVVWARALAPTARSSMTVSWDGRTSRGERAPAAVYWIALETERGVTARRIVRVR